MIDADDAFTIDDFDIDLATRTATCPAGHTVAMTTMGRANFRRRCEDCPMQTRCTRAKDGKRLHIHPRHEQLARARHDAADAAWQDRYRRHRPMVERSIAWLVARGHRQVAYRGIDRNRLWLAHRAAAADLKRLLVLGLNHDGKSWNLPATA